MTDLTTIHAKIKQHLAEEFKDIKTLDLYPKLYHCIDTPALFVELSRISPKEQISSGQMILELEFTARVMLEADKDIDVRSLAIKVATKITGRDFGQENLSPAVIGSIEADYITPELDTYLCWQVVWTHEMVVGDDLTDNNTPVPEEVHIGYEPVVGKLNKEHYSPLNFVQGLEVDARN